jgi:hypothetical protein
MDNSTIPIPHLDLHALASSVYAVAAALGLVDEPGSAQHTQVMYDPESLRDLSAGALAIYEAVDAELERARLAEPAV